MHITVLSLTHKMRLHFSPIYFNCNKSVAGHKKRRVSFTQRNSMLRSSVDSTFTICFKVNWEKPLHTLHKMFNDVLLCSCEMQ